MANVLRRLQKLEAHVTDRSGYVPHSDAWFAHWSERYDRFLTTGDAEAINGMPLAYIDDMLAKVDREALQKEITSRNGNDGERAAFMEPSTGASSQDVLHGHSPKRGRLETPCAASAAPKVKAAYVVD